MSKTDILLVSSQNSLQELFQEACEKLKVSCHAAISVDESFQKIDENAYRLIYIDLDDEEMRSLQLMEWLNTRGLEARVGLVSKKSYTQDFLQAIKLGAQEFLGNYKDDADYLSLRIRDSLKLIDRLYELSRYHFTDGNGNLQTWVGGHPETRLALLRAQELSGLLSPVLVRGENGTGKRMMALVLTQGHSQVFEMDAKEVDDFEHRQVMMTWIESLASKSVSFLIHHVEYLHHEMQEFLSEYLKSGQIEWDGQEVLGSFQLVVTTNQSLDYQGQLREDLQHLLAMNVIDLKPLRERESDIEVLVRHFLDADERRNSYFSEDALTALTNYQWPGNVDELKAVVDEVIEKATESMIPSKLLPAHILEQSFYRSGQEGDEDLTDFTYNEAKKRVLNKFNRDYIENLLEKSDNNLTVAAEQAGMDRSNFKKIIKKFGLSS